MAENLEMIIMLQERIHELPLPKAELDTRNSTKRPSLCGRLVEFLVFNWIFLKKSASPNAENRLTGESS